MLGRDRVFTRSFSVSSESDAIKERLDLEMVVVTEEAGIKYASDIDQTLLSSLPCPYHSSSILDGDGIRIQPGRQQ